MIIKEKILQSLQPLLDNSRFVSISRAALEPLAKKILNSKTPEMQPDFQGSPAAIVQYYFFVDSLNFCFWTPKGEERWSIMRDDKTLRGSQGLSFAIAEAAKSNTLLLDARHLSQISLEGFAKIFAGTNAMPLLKERHAIIVENFRILEEKYAGQALNLVLAAERDANRLVELLAQDFPSFRDIAKFQGQPVYFLKRAQLFVNDIFLAFHGAAPGDFRNMDDLAIFADYKLPQILQTEGVLEYVPELFQKIQNEELIPASSQEELEIRANTVWACELLLQELHRLDSRMNSAELDMILWFSAKGAPMALPVHKTLTANY